MAIMVINLHKNVPQPAQMDRLEIIYQNNVLIYALQINLPIKSKIFALLHALLDTLETQ